MRKHISLMLICLLVTALLFGCKRGQSVEGKWKASVDLRDALGAEAAGISSFSIDVVFEFREDGTYTMIFEKTSVEAAVDKLIREREAAVVKELEEKNPGKTAQEILAAGGTTLSQLMAPMQEKKTELVEKITALSRSGSFKAEEGKLWLSDGKAAFDENTYDCYTLEGDTLKLTEHIGSAVQDSTLYKILYPLVLQRTN